MNILQKWAFLALGLMAITFPAWYFGIGLWAGYSYLQFQLLTGQATIALGIVVQMFEQMNQDE